MEIEALSAKLRKFAADRDWEQFHSPKNLTSALVVEAAELLEIFQWMKEDESKNLDERTLGKVKEEIADIQIYLLRISDVIGISIPEAVEAKIKKNIGKYPIDKAKGTSKKYDEL
ncbi:MAG: nucleotide pyrophosphohydrolase [Nitrospinota bacterium]